MTYLRCRPLLVLVLVLISGTIQAAQQDLTVLPNRPLAPDFTLQDQDGNTQRLSDYQGNVVIVNFWATWCPPCRKEMPSMQRAWEELREDGVAMLAVGSGENATSVSEFLEETPVDFPLLPDSASTVTTAWPVRGLPTTYVVDTKGRLAYRVVGVREWDDPKLLNQIRSLQRESDQQ